MTPTNIVIERVERFGVFSAPFHHLEVLYSRNLTLRLWEASIYAGTTQTESPIEGTSIVANEARYLELVFASVGAIEICDELLVRKDWNIDVMSWPSVHSSVFNREIRYPIVKVLNSDWSERFNLADPNFADMQHFTFISLDMTVDILTEELPTGNWRRSRVGRELN